MFKGAHTRYSVVYMGSELATLSVSLCQKSLKW